jgi:hypothetical protein
MLSYAVDPLPPPPAVAGVPDDLGQSTAAGVSAGSVHAVMHGAPADFGVPAVVGVPAVACVPAAAVVPALACVLFATVPNVDAVLAVAIVPADSCLSAVAGFPDDPGVPAVLCVPAVALLLLLTSPMEILIACWEKANFFGRMLNQRSLRFMLMLSVR